MSYRSFKRVLGETSLERKCRFLFGACLLLLIACSFLWYGKQTEQLVYKQNKTKGELLVMPIMLKIHWDALEVKNTSDTAWREVVVPSMSRELLMDDYQWTFLREGPKDKNGRPQDHEDKAIYQQFLQDPTAEYAERYPEPGDNSYYVYYQPIRMQKNCMTCHVRPPESAGIDLGSWTPTLVQDRPAGEGDVVGIIKIQILNDATQRDLAVNRAILITTAIITVALAMLASYAIVKYVIVKPLKHLRDVSDAISHGNIDQRAELRTADEFEELGVAFNRMLRHLVAAQEELRHVNADLDSKVDELAQMNMRLFENNRLKSDFLATMSHELRTPLNSIIGFTDVLGSIKTLDDKQKRYVQNIQKSGKMLLDMINDILDLAKVESGKMEIRLTDFRAEHVIGAQCDMARPLTEKKNIDLEVEVDGPLPPLHQDQGKVQQILNNLLSNAIKFTPEGGRIVVTAKRAATGDFLLIVADTGVGIAEEDQIAIFEKFRQGRVVLPGGDAMTREFSGTGLGLSIVKELCKLLGGEVSLKSELGKGSVFLVRLPWNLEHAPATSEFAASVDELTRPRRIEYQPAIGPAAAPTR